ncbi:MAG: LCP family protein [Atopobiaceae bacterium]|nr:LCP family protein [Atopobiaceae bacterium]
MAPQNNNQKRDLNAAIPTLSTASASAQLSRTSSLQHYSEQRVKRQRMHVIRLVAVVALAVIVALAGGAMFYINNIQGRLNSNVNDDLRENLATVEAGEPFYMLLLGVDKNIDRINDEEYGPEASAYRSDSIMLVRIDPKDVKVTLVSIHRDTLVRLGVHGEEKINAAYSIGGPSFAVETVSKFAGVPIAHYAEVDFDSFCMIVDSLGGIEVDVPVDVIDPDYTGAEIFAGHQLVNGDQALQLCRARHAYDDYGDGDVFRAANQRMVIAAIVKKVLQSNAAQLALITSQLADSVTTDMSIGEILSLAEEMRGLDVDNNVYSGMAPTESHYANDTWYEICDTDAWRTMMTRVNAGLRPLADDEVDPTAGIAGNVPLESQASESEEKVLTVLALNASETDGLGSELAAALNELGLEAEADTQEAKSETTVVVYNNDKADAEAVAEYLSGDYSISANNGTVSEDYDVVVVIGEDYVG